VADADRGTFRRIHFVGRADRDAGLAIDHVGRADGGARLAVRLIVRSGRGAVFSRGGIVLADDGRARRRWRRWRGRRGRGRRTIVGPDRDSSKVAAAEILWIAERGLRHG